MSINSEFSEFRLRLDEAITYGTKTEAMKIAQQGLGQAKEKNFLGEVEYFKGQLAILRKHFACAIEHFDAAIKDNPSDGAAYNDRALCMVELGIIEEAFFYFNKGIEVEPDYATIYHNKGWLLNELGRYTEAIECFKKALALEPQRAVTYENLASALFNLSDYRGAQEAYKKALALLKPDCRREIKKHLIAEIKRLLKKSKDKAISD